MQAGHEGHVIAGSSQLPNSGSGLESLISGTSGNTGTFFTPQMGLESSFAGYQFSAAYVPYIILTVIGIYVAYRLVKYFASSINNN